MPIIEARRTTPHAQLSTLEQELEAETWRHSIDSGASILCRLTSFQLVCGDDLIDFQELDT